MKSSLLHASGFAVCVWKCQLHQGWMWNLILLRVRPKWFMLDCVSLIFLILIFPASSLLSPGASSFQGILQTLEEYKNNAISSIFLKDFTRLSRMEKKKKSICKIPLRKKSNQWLLKKERIHGEPLVHLIAFSLFFWAAPYLVFIWSSCCECQIPTFSFKKFAPQMMDAFFCCQWWHHPLPSTRCLPHIAWRWRETATRAMDLGKPGSRKTMEIQWEGLWLWSTTETRMGIMSNDGLEIRLRMWKKGV